MKKIALSIAFASISIIGYSQSHNYNPCCRYTKSNVTAECICPACEKDKDDEKKALQAEAKREKDRIAQETAKKAEEIKKSSEELARKKEEDRKEREKNTVYIEAPISNIKNKSSANANPTNNTVMYAEPASYSNGSRASFKDSSNNILFYLEDNIFVYPTHFNSYSFIDRFPGNLGIILIDVNKMNTESKMNIAYPDGKREFPEENIPRRIFFIKDKWFMIESRMGISLYNLVSKERIPLPLVENDVSWEYHYMPIYESGVYQQSNEYRPWWKASRKEESIALKAQVIKDFPDKVSEVQLKESQFCIVITTGRGNVQIPERISDYQTSFAYLSKAGKLLIK